MRTTVYWTIQHSRRSANELRFRVTCWWRSHQVESLEWRLRLEKLMSPAHCDPTATSARQRAQSGGR